MCHHYHFTYTAYLTLDEIKMIKEPNYHTNTILYIENDKAPHNGYP